MPKVQINKSVDHGWAWMVLFGGFTIYFLSQGIDKCMGLIYLELLEKLNGTASTTAWVIATATSGRLILAPFTSALCKKYGCRIVTIIGGSLASLGLFLASFPISLTFEFFAIGLCYGLGSGLYFPSQLIMTVEYFDKRLGMAASIGAAGGGLGIMVFPMLFNAFTNLFGFSGALFLLSAINLHVVLAGAIFRPPVKVTVDEDSELDEKDILLNGNTCNGSLNTDSGNHVETNVVEANGVHENGVTGCNENVQILAVSFEDGHNVNGNCVEMNGKVKTVNGQACNVNGKTGVETNCGATSKIVYENTQNSHNDQCLHIKDDPDRSLSVITDGDQGASNRGKHCCRKKPGFLPDISILKHPGFCLYMAQTLLVGLAQLPFLTFFAALAEERGASHDDAALLLTISGIVDIPAKLLTGFIVDIKRIRPHRRHVLNVTIFLNAVIIAVTPFTSVFAELAAVGLCLGLTIGVYGGQLLVVLVDVVGRDRQADALGLCMFARSISLLCGPSLVGYIKDITKSYNNSFYMCGAAGALGALLFTVQFFFFPIPPSKGTVIVDEKKDTEKEISVRKQLAMSTLSLS